MYGSGSLTRSGVTLALFPLVSRPPSSGGVILGSASYIDKLFDTGEFALSRSCIHAKRTQGVYQKSATSLCQIRCGFANSTPGGIWPVDQETSRQNMRTDQVLTRQGARSGGVPQPQGGVKRTWGCCLRGAREASRVAYRSSRCCSRGPCAALATIPRTDRDSPRRPGRVDGASRERSRQSSGESPRRPPIDPTVCRSSRSSLPSRSNRW
jgi:hypothetical protein